MRYLIFTLLLSGCAAGVAPFDVDPQLLKRCEPVPLLEGSTGQAVLHWARSAGPGIRECALNHNALVRIIEAQKE